MPRVSPKPMVDAAFGEVLVTCEKIKVPPRAPCVSQVYSRRDLGALKRESLARETALLKTDMGRFSISAP